MVRCFFALGPKRGGVAFSAHQLREKRAYTNLATLSALTEEQGYANRALVASQAHEPAAQATVRRKLEQALQQANINIAASQTVAAQYQSLLDHIVIIVNSLILMAILVAAVGGLGLMLTLLLATIASTIPARQATQLPVSQALAYE